MHPRGSVRTRIRVPLICNKKSADKFFAGTIFQDKLNKVQPSYLTNRLTYL